MKFSIPIALLTIIAAVSALPQPNNPIEECDDWREKLPREQKIQLELLATEFGDFEEAMLKKYPVHFCLAQDDTCDWKCAYMWAEDIPDGLLRNNCMDKMDLDAYLAKREAVRVLEHQLNEEYA